MTRLAYLFLGFLLLFFVTCTTNSIDPEKATIQIHFEHINNNAPLVLDQRIYTNTVGQQYSIKTVKYFISNITFHNADGKDYVSPEIHYVDIRDAQSLSLELAEKVPYGTYTSISFVYGIVAKDNVTGSLGIDLDRLMEWPVPMGGGYHYMKLEGDYVGTTDTSFFNFHAGPLAGNDYSIPVNIPISNALIDSNTFDINLVMDVGNWFKNPTNWDFEYWGSAIMGNPDAQATIQKNGADVFSITFPLEN